MIIKRRIEELIVESLQAPRIFEEGVLRFGGAPGGEAEHHRHCCRAGAWKLRREFCVEAGSGQNALQQTKGVGVDEEGGARRRERWRLEDNKRGRGRTEGRTAEVEEDQDKDQTVLLRSPGAFRLSLAWNCFASDWCELYAPWSISPRIWLEHLAPA